MPTDPVAVVDIGSNSIKILIATRDPDGRLQALGMKTIDARISAGISQQEPRLTEEGMERGLSAVRELLAFASPHQPAQVILVATSAVRDAGNGDVFRARVQAATGYPVRLLGGDEEANLIGRGLAADPALDRLRDFYVFDLGGGSLECLSFRGRRIQEARSFPLGCVRVTEQFVHDVSAPFTAADHEAIANHVRGVLTRSGFRFDLPAATAVFAGGSMTATRLILAAEAGAALDATPARVPVAEVRRILHRVGPLPLAARQQVPGLPPARADVYPAALATMLAVAEIAGVDAFLHSFYNLRWGVADEVLAVERTEET